MYVILSAVMVLNILLGGFVLFKNPRSPINRTFALTALGVAGWTFGIFLVHHERDLLAPHLSARIPFIMAVLVLYALVALFASLPPCRHERSSLVSRSVGGAALAFLLLSCTDLILKDLTVSDGVAVAVRGSLYPAYAVFAFVCILVCIVIISLKLYHTHGLERVQLIYFALGLLIPGCLVLLTNLFVPLVLRTSRLSQYGPLFSLIMVALIAHAIVRHRLMNMRVVIRKGAVYCAAFAAAGAILAASIYVAARLFSTAQFGLMSHILLGLTVGVVFHPLKTLIQRLFDRYLYRTQYHYQSTLKTASEVIARRLRLQALLACVTEVIQRTMRNEWLAVYLKDDSPARGYMLQSSAVNSASSKVRPPTEMHDGEPIPTALTTRGTILSVDAKPGDSVTAQLSRLGVDLAIPLLDENGLIGFVLLGPKLSGDPHFPDDLDLLATVAHQAEVAIKNVQLYRQVVRINEHLQNIVATIESGVIAVDAGGEVTMFNRTAEQMTGLHSERALRRRAAALPGAVGEPLLATLGDGQQRVIPETDLGRGDGSTLPIICVTSPLREPTGEFLGAVAVFSDLTPLKQLEMERRRAERLVYFERMAAGFAHEIKNPLVAIKTFMQLLPRRGHDEHFREGFGQVAAREIARMERLLERLRALAKPGSRPQHPLDLRLPITDAVEILQARFDEKRITVRWQPGSEPCPIVGDREEMEQLFLNLFINALEAMEPGGTLTVTVRERDGRPVVDVEDTGPGIAEEVLVKMFDPFVTTKLYGSGLGLAICASVADSHRATIRANNKSGSAGAVFTVEFPTEAQVPTLRTA